MAKKKEIKKCPVGLFNLSGFGLYGIDKSEGSYFVFTNKKKKKVKFDEEAILHKIYLRDEKGHIE